MKLQIKNLISVVYSLLKFSILKLCHPNSFKSGLVERFSPNTIIDIGKHGILTIGNKVSAHAGTHFRVCENGKMFIGEGCKFNNRCEIISMEEIIIGNNTILGPNVLIYDHDHDFAGNGIISENGFKTTKVEIGQNVWIGASSIILRGTKIGDNCVVGAGCVLKGVYEDDLIITQSRVDKIMSRRKEKEDLSSI